MAASQPFNHQESQRPVWRRGGPRLRILRSVRLCLPGLCSLALILAACGSDSDTSSEAGSEAANDGNESAETETSANETSTTTTTTTTTTTAASSSTTESTTATTSAASETSSVLADPDTTKPSVDESTPTTVSGNSGDPLIDQVIGMTESAAIDLIKSTGRGVRVESRDGEEFMLTQDFEPDRLNLTVVNDLVTGVRLG